MVHRFWSYIAYDVLKNVYKTLFEDTLFPVKMEDKSTVEVPGYELVEIRLDKDGQSVKCVFEIVLCVASIFRVSKEIPIPS